jgi:exportin-7
VQRIMQHIETDPECFFQLLNSLFTSMLFSTAVNHWPLTRPILSLILIAESSFVEYQKHLASSQTQENQTKLAAEFTKLTENLQRSLEVSNRDKFTQRVTVFRANVRSFMNL